MNNLDDLAAIKNIDKVNVLGSIEQLGLQCQQAWEDVKAIEFPDSYKHVSNIVFAGMGGSSLGAYVIKSLFFDTLKLPFEIVNDYHLPPYANEKTLVIVCSYSGTTEEALSAAQEAVTIKAQLTGIAIGKELSTIFQKAGVPAYIFHPLHNPSGQPRLGTGYTAYSQIAILTKLGFLSVTDEDTNAVVSVTDKGNSFFGVNIPTDTNRTKKLAMAWNQKIPVIVSAEFLGHVGRVIRNQLHESAKTFAAYHMIPELNHHLMEGLANPSINKDVIKILFLTSKDYSAKIAKRFTVTRTVVEKQGIEVEEFQTTAKSKVAQAIECIQFGAYVNYYMALLYDLDPSKIPWVDYFKEELAKT